MSNPLKRSNEDTTSIAKTMKLLEEDHLSQIFDDCLLDILSRLDHDDLDEISTVSGKMRILSVLSRSKAVKVPAEELNIIQDTNAQILIGLCFPQADFFIDNSNNYEMSGKMTSGDRGIGMKGSSEHPQTQINSEAVVNRTIALLGRFDVSSYTFDSVSIDDHFVRCVESFVSSRSFSSFTLKRCVLDENLNSNGKEKLLSILLNAKPDSLSLHCNSLLLGEERAFMNEYAQQVELPELYYILSFLVTHYLV